MIIVEFHPAFRKAYRKRIAHIVSLQDQVSKRIAVFQQNPRHPLLRDHPLKGEQLGLRAFSVTGDIRIVYSQVDEHRVLFLDIGTHNQVY